MRRRVCAPGSHARAGREGIARPEEPGILALQRSAGNAAVARLLSQGSVEAVAAAGARTHAGALPFREAIEASFGRGLGSVRAHVDEGAAAALGAEAYAVGEDVVFAEPPDIETAAHEAAHVVQAREGIGAPGVSAEHERHADEAASHAVLGEPAGPLPAGPAPPVQLRKVTVRGKEQDTDKMKRPAIYRLISQLVRTNTEADNRAAQDLLNALHDGDFDTTDEDSDYEEESESSSDEELIGATSRALPTAAYDRYAEIHEAKLKDPEEQKKKKRGRGGRPLDKSKLAQNTTAVAVYEESGLELPELDPTKEGFPPELAETNVPPEAETHDVFLAQRSYPGMSDLATENLMTLGISPGVLNNIHAEMYGLYQEMQKMVNEGMHDHMVEVHPSNPVCFFCEVMLKLFDIRYDEDFVSYKLFPKWKDPTGFVPAEPKQSKKSKAEQGEAKKKERRYYTPRMMLQQFGMDVGEAAARVLPLLKDVAKPELFVQRILDGGLQGRELAKMIKDLKAASATLREANERGRGGAKAAEEGEEGAEEELKVDETGDPAQIPGVGLLQDVGTRNNNCLIEAVLTAAGIPVTAERVDAIRNHLVQQRVANVANPLDLAGIAGAVLISFLVSQGLIAAERGLVVHFWAREGELGDVTVLDGAHAVHLWLNHGHFQAVRGPL